MVEFKSTLTERLLLPVVGRIRPFYSRLMDAAICILMLCLLFFMATAFGLLFDTSLDFMETYNKSDEQVRSDTYSLLTEQGTFWKLAIVILVGLPLFLYICYLAFRSFHSIFDNRYVTRQQLKKLKNSVGLEFLYNISDNEISVTDRVDKTTVQLTEFEKVEWLDNAAILYPYASSTHRGFFFLIFDAEVEAEKIHKTKKMLRNIVS